MNEDARALLIQLGEDPDDPKIVENYAYMESALAIYAEHYRRTRHQSTN
ncbi:MAG: hypothetical protein V7694_21370 [Rhodococcus sp. (in: high G+C Gram-positive bacteria)]